MDYQKIFYPGLIPDDDVEAVFHNRVWPLVAAVCLKSRGRLKVVKVVKVQRRDTDAVEVVLGAVGLGGFPCLQLSYLRYDMTFEFKNWFQNVRKTPKKDETKRRTLLGKKDIVLAKKILKEDAMGNSIISKVVDMAGYRMIGQLNDALGKVAELDKEYGNTRAQPTHALADDAIVDAMRVIFCEKDAHDLSVSRVEQFKRLKDIAEERHTKRQQQYNHVKEFFSDDMTVLAYNKGIDCYMLGRIACEVDGLRVSKYRVTQPFAAYRTLDDIPAVQREPLLRELTMHKVHFQMNSTREYADPANYIPLEDTLFDDMNAISWNSRYEGEYVSPTYLLMRYVA